MGLFLVSLTAVEKTSAEKTIAPPPLCADSTLFFTVSSASRRSLDALEYSSTRVKLGKTAGDCFFLCYYSCCGASATGVRLLSPPLEGGPRKEKQK